MDTKGEWGEGTATGTRGETEDRGEESTADDRGDRDARHVVLRAVDHRAVA